MSKLLSKGSMTSGFITLPMKRIDPMRKQQKPFLKEIILFALFYCYLYFYPAKEESN